MEQKIAKLISACLALIMALPFIFAPVLTVQAQPGDEIYTIPFIGISDDHEGGAGWNADGSGPEPYGYGHQIPFPDWTSQVYYLASRDYGGIDPDPEAAGVHFMPGITGFPLFVQALADYGYSPQQVKMKWGLSSLGDDILGHDWFVMGDWLHSIYYDNPFRLYLDGHLILDGVCGFQDMNIQNVPLPGWECESAYFRFDSVWVENAPAGIKGVGRAFLNDLDGQEARAFFTDIEISGTINENGRDGSLYNLTGYLERGLPQLPYLGMAAEHQGMAGWNADGSGPEPPADGHAAQRYYIASRDYNDIDTDPDAAFGHFLPEMEGFLNFGLQLLYRGYTADQLVIKQGLASLGNDAMGLDWGFENGTDYWCNYYDIEYALELDNEIIITGLIDTSHSWMNTTPVYWWCDATVDRPKNGAALASPDAQIIAGAFMKDLEDRHLINDVQTLTYDTATFEGNGRYDGGFFNVAAARLVGQFSESCCFVQCDSLQNGMTDHTEWTLDHSPYFLDNDLVISEGHTLVIRPGVVVAVRGPYFIKVNGRVMAQGTEEQGIMFTHSNPLRRWNSLIYDAPPDLRTSVFEYCTFERSHSVKPSPLNSGGAFGIRDFDSVVFSHCNFRYNYADKPGYLPPSGGAIALWNSSPVMEYCSFTGNVAAYGGAVICYSYSSPYIAFSLFNGNYAEMDGGAIELYEQAAPVLMNNTIADNRASHLGGGIDIYLSNADSIMFTNNIIWDNQCAEGQPGQQISLTSADNIVSFKYNDLEGGADGFGPFGYSHIYYAASNINDDPLFCGPESLSPYKLVDISPCFQTGYGGANIGAFDTGCIMENIIARNRYESRLAFFPNPASAKWVNVIFDLESPCNVKLEIFNLTGRKEAEPFNTFYSSGEHRVIFNVETLPAGIYIGRLTAGDSRQTAKFIKMK